jgi:hypothetical protein
VGEREDGEQREHAEEDPAACLSISRSRSVRASKKNMTRPITRWIERRNRK